MNQKEFLAIFYPFCEYFNTQLSKNVLNLYYHDLKHLSVNELLDALSHIRKTRKYTNMPTIAEILEASEGDFESKMILARDELKKAMIKYGPYKSVCFKDKALMAVVKAIGGWINYANMQGDELKKFYTFEFPKLYKAYVNKPEVAPDYLIGIVENEVTFKNGNLSDLEVIFIGFSDKTTSPLLLFKQELDDKNPLKIALKKAYKRINNAAI